MRRLLFFFVLSGYLVGGKAVDRIVNGIFQPTDYLVDRISRIWTPLLPALVLSAFVGGGDDGVVVWIGNMVALQNVTVPVLGGNGPLWSLTYEVWFYVLVYAVGRQALSRSFDIVACALLVAFFLVFTQLSIQYLACWLIGALFYLRPPALTVRFGLILSVCVLIFAGAGLQISSGGYLQVLDASAWRALLEILLAIGAGVGCVVLVKMPSNRFIRWAPAWAAFSYTLYLTHYPLLIALRRTGWVEMTVLDTFAFGCFCSAVVALLFVAWIFYLPFERNTD